ncbi:hypothetical protein E4U21_000919 [Claviceps maximensis]|nr:hypothetical protein E4U21_000919 [Claviceps maximensis]
MDSYFYGTTPNSLPICQQRRADLVNDLDYAYEWFDTTGHVFLSHYPDLGRAGFPNTFMVYEEKAAKGFNNAIKGYRYLTPDESTAQSPSIASEGVSSLLSDSHQSCRSMMSPDLDHGCNSPPAHSSVQGISGKEVTHVTSSFFSPMENAVDISRNSQLALVPLGSYEDMGRQDIWSHFAQPPLHNLPATSTEDSLKGMAYDESGGDSQVDWPSFHTQRTIKEEYCAQQAIFHEPLDETAAYPAEYAAHPTYNAAEKLSPILSPSASTAMGHYQQVAAVSPSSSPDGPGHGSCCKSCKKTTSAPKASPKPDDSTSCQALYCLFAFAGCDCRCKGKNEWKRHLKTQHLLSRIFACPHCPNKNFNRKDLFTQHYLRTHCTQAEQGAYKMKKTSPELDKMLQEKQAQAEKDETVSPPAAPTCLFQGCEARFTNDGTSWDKCLDHVSKHLEAMVAGNEAYRDYKFTHDQMVHFEALGAIAQGDHGRWILGAQSNGERARENKKKIGKRPANADAVESHKMSKRRRKDHY